MISLRRKILLSIIGFIILIILGFLLSWKSIPNQEGYAETSWNLSHSNFNKYILYKGVTPLNYLTVYFIEKNLSLSIANSWKLMDLFFGGLIVIFLINIYWKYQKTSNLFQQILPFLIIISSFNFIYPLTSMTGEGLPVFTALVGTYLWGKRKFPISIIFFILSLLAKYTVYLISPGIIVWTFINFSYFKKDEKIKLLLSSTFYILVFFLYHYLKNWGDILLQSSYSQNFSIKELFYNLFPFIITYFLGSPFIQFLFLPRIKFLNIYVLASISAQFMLLRHYFYWHYPFQVLPFIILYLFTYPYLYKFLQYKYLILQIFITITIINLLPVIVKGNVIFPKHFTQSESLLIDYEIKKDYHGGKIGYYMNRRFDEPFPNYEISYMDPSWDFVIENTEYVVIPIGGLPQQLLNFKQCHYEFYKQVTVNNIFKVICNQKRTNLQL